MQPNPEQTIAQVRRGLDEARRRQRCGGEGSNESPGSDGPFIVVSSLLTVFGGGRGREPRGCERRRCCAACAERPRQKPGIQDCGVRSLRDKLAAVGPDNRPRRRPARGARPGHWGCWPGWPGPPQNEPTTG